MTTPKINARLEHVKRSPSDRRAAVTKLQESLCRPHASMTWSIGGGSIGIHTLNMPLVHTLKRALDRQLERLGTEMGTEFSGNVRRDYVRDAIQEEINRSHDLLNFVNEMVKALACSQSLPQLKEDVDAS